MSKKIEIPKDELQTLLQVRLNGPEIGWLYSCSNTTVCKVVLAYGLPALKPGNKGRPKPTISGELSPTKRPEVRKLLRLHSQHLSGSKNPNYGKGCFGAANGRWKGGIKPLTAVVRESELYLKWRKDVFIAAGGHCSCGCSNVEAHHKVEFKVLFDDFMAWSGKTEFKSTQELLDLASKYKPFWDTSNGMALCKACHKKQHKSYNFI